MNRWKIIPKGLCAWALLSTLTGTAAALTCFSNVLWVADGGNDGDSFLVQLDPQKKVRIRLYFADCPETGGSWESDLRRIREQCRYFGLTDEKTLVEQGRRAAAFTQEQLQRPFTVYTAFASALGRSADGRVYGFVETADGHDLATLLVQSGLARAYGVGRENPAGLKRDEIKAQLTDLEASAMLKNAGVWEYSDPDLLSRLRAEQRREDLEIGAIRSVISSKENAPEEPPSLLAINSATEKELRSLPGVGPALAERIITNRPYRQVEDLLNVRGISKDQLERIRPLIGLD